MTTASSEKPSRAEELRRTGTPFTQFRQEVRRHKPSELIPLLARFSTNLGDPPYELEQLKTLTPWFPPVAARESVLWGNEHRRGGIKDNDLRTLINLFNNPAEPRDTPGMKTVESIFTRIAYQQFPYQESMHEELGRTHALLVEPLDDPPELEVITPTVWEDLLGAPMGQAVGATFLHHVGAQLHSGLWDPAWLEHPDLVEMTDLWPRAAIDATSERLTMTFEQFKADYNAVPIAPAGYERYGYNPLSKAPFLVLPDGRMMTPQYQLILRTVTPGGLYYPGIKTYGEPFARDLGVLSQHYVGRQLSTIDGADLHPEFSYGPKRRRRDSTDWFLVLPNLLVLIEVKSSRIPMEQRAGGSGLIDTLRRILDKAVGQLETSHEAIIDATPGFTHLPTGVPVVGLVVTTEPFYLANSQWVRQHLRETTFPTLVASMRDLEHLVSLPAEAIEEHLLEIANDEERSTWDLSTALRDIPPGVMGRNRILDEAWNTYPMPDDDGDEN